MTQGVVTARACTILLLGGLIFACSACGPLGTTSSSENPKVVALVLVDVSKSTLGKGGRQRAEYQRSFRTILDNVPGGTLLKGDVIDANPLAHATLPISVYFEAHDLAQNTEFAVRQQQTEARREARAAFYSLIRRRPRGNAIIDALSLAEKIFDSYPDASTRYLVIFSDMFENSDRYSFRPANLRPARVARFIARERDGGTLPKLGGAEVYVVGAGATRGVDATPRHIRAVERFWLAYLAAAGGQLSEDRYGPTLVRFP